MTQIDPRIDTAANEVTYEVVNGVAWVTLNRPEARNALNAATRAGLFEAVHRFNADTEAKVLVLTGAGDIAFCAGGDLKEMADHGVTLPPRDFLPYFGRTITVDKPTIAAVNGVAYAGGFLLAQMCDLVVAADHARFAVTEVKVGRGSPWAAPLPWLIPPRVAMQLLMTGDPIDAARAREIGLVNEVVPAERLREATQELGERIASNAPLSVAASKAMVYAAADLGWHDALDKADRIWQPVYLSADAQEGPRSFREKRKPRWQGR
ncbi:MULTISPECIES: enoyl-CoA hydratase/isomerase family protein [Rhodococcus]|uniref:enoyl-CoA hydratase/isomerase family protein n=1 Tax=Rhodococcus TaxID=1827 RepID=UPI00101FE269|nr:MULTISPECIES: enoyl-CoA hydratase/isomerase family protein [Rhodococcus]UTT51117.1 enoyl-CoA hydratase/isomerase family protein [Rhodococcus gordoniae]